ncbi:hypothetical protein Tco_1261279 [Tanacetum coccineum]
MRNSKQSTKDCLDYFNNLKSPCGNRKGSLWISFLDFQGHRVDKIVARVGPVAYTLRLPEEFQGIHITFHISNLKKCLADENLIIPLDEIQLDDKLHFIEEPVEIIDRKVKRLK